MAGICLRWPCPKQRHPYVSRISDFSVRAMHAFGEQAGNSSTLSSSGLSLEGYLSGGSATLGASKIALT